MSVRLSSSLPDDDRNGLAAIASSLVDRPEEVHVVVSLVRCKEIRTVPASGAVIPTAELLACEAFTGATADAGTLHRLLRRQHERRTGKVELPLELEEAIDALDLPSTSDNGDDEAHNPPPLPDSGDDQEEGEQQW